MSPTSTGFSLWRALKGVRAIGLAVLALAAADSAKAAAPWSTIPNPEIMQPGIAAVTCAARTGIPASPAYVFALFDLRNPNPADYGVCGLTAPLWVATDYHHASWNVTNLGNIFGIALDGDGDMYVASHGLYAKNWTTTGVSGYFHRYGALGGWSPGGPLASRLRAAGTIYKIDRITGAATVFNVAAVDRLPQQPMNLGGSLTMEGPGIGNIAYDPVNDQFFASNLEDGKIYRLNNAGVVQPPAFDPLTLDGGAAGLPPLTDIVWGLGVSGGKLYFAVWSHATLTLQTQIRSVNILGGGALDTVDAPVLTVSQEPSASASIRSPVSDITFSANGTRMFLAERTMRMSFGAPESYNHYSRVHLAEFSTGWTVTRTLQPGCNWGLAEAYGGVALGPEGGVNEQVVHMTSADMATSAGPHGIYGVRFGDFPNPGPALVSRSYKVPFDPAFNHNGPDVKGSGGDVAIMPVGCCVKIDNKLVECVSTNKSYLWQVCITNCWDQDIKYFSFLDLPPGLTINEEIVTLPSVLKPGQGTCLTLYLTNAPGLTNACFTVGAHTTNFFVCCSVTNCLTFAPCCVYLTSEKLTPISMSPPMGNCYNYTFTVKNVTYPPIPIKYLFLVQDPAPPPGCITFTPEVITFNPPLQPNQSMTKTVKVCLTPGCKGPYYFLAAAHNTNLMECCSTRHCLPKSSFCHPIDIPAVIDHAIFVAGSTIRVPVIIDRTIVQPRRAIGYDGTNAVASIVDPTDGQHDDWFVISNAVAGTHILRAELTDTLGGVWTSEPVTVYVLEETAPSEGPPAPVLFVPAAALNAGQVRFLLRTEPGVTCHVEFTESLSPANWQVFQTIVGDGTTVTITDTVTNAPQRFFRVRMP